MVTGIGVGANRVALAGAGAGHRVQRRNGACCGAGGQARRARRERPGTAADRARQQQALLLAGAVQIAADRHALTHGAAGDRAERDLRLARRVAGQGRPPRRCRTQWPFFSVCDHVAVDLGLEQTLRVPVAVAVGPDDQAVGGGCARHRCQIDLGIHRTRRHPADGSPPSRAASSVGLGQEQPLREAVHVEVAADRGAVPGRRAGDRRERDVRVQRVGVGRQRA